MSLVISSGVVLAKDFTWNESIWNPSMIQTALWLDAADASTISTSGSAVSQWRDKSGGGVNFAQTNADLRPQTGSELLGGKNVITFDGIDDSMNAGNALNNVWTGNAFNIFFAAKNNNVDSSSGNVLTKASNSPLNLRQFYSTIRSNKAALGIFYTPDVFNYTIVQGSTTLTNSQWVLCSQAYTNTGSGSADTTSRVQMTVNGTSEAPAVIGYTGNLGTIQSASGLLAIGGIVGDGTQSASNLNGAIAELIVTPSVLSTLQRQKLEGYLAHKWGLTANLPADHPYKTVGPTP